MSSITIRGCCIGAGRPKVILPIVARTEDDILREARRLSALKADCIEWRADWFPGNKPALDLQKAEEIPQIEKILIDRSAGVTLDRFMVY